MATIVTREVGGTAKGSPLTNAELDQNFINLNAAVVSVAPVAISTNTNAVVDNYYSFTGACTLTLPAGAANGSIIRVRNDTSNTSGCIIARNGSTIGGKSEDMTIDLPYCSFQLINNSGWELYEFT